MAVSILNRGAGSMDMPELLQITAPFSVAHNPFEMTPRLYANFILLVTSYLVLQTEKRQTGYLFHVHNSDISHSQYCADGIINYTQSMHFLFYRMLHHPYMYKRIHKIHHEWTAPIGVTSLYAHPLVE